MSKHDKTGATLERVYVNGSGDYLIMVEGVSGWMSIGKAGNPAADAMYMTALQAKLANESNLWIRYWTSDEDKYPSVGIICVN